jgi:predicted outer membrane protein
MKTLMSLVVVVAALFAVELPVGQATVTEPHPRVAAAKKVKASVTGIGKSKFLAEVDAAKAAREVSGGSYSTVRKNTTGSGSSWTCAMTIEYTPK